MKHVNVLTKGLATADTDLPLDAIIQYIIAVLTALATLLTAKEDIPAK